ncbi:MAG: YqgE/AlgH family protein, partial [Acidobacteriota bacterium]
QLRGEMQEGAWYRVEAEGDLIFSTDPQSLWRTLHSRAAPSKYIKYLLPPAGPKASARKAAAM